MESIKKEEQETRDTRSCGAARASHPSCTQPEALEVFPKVTQKLADMRWVVNCVHQIVLWVGTARQGMNAKERTAIRGSAGQKPTVT